MKSILFFIIESAWCVAMLFMGLAFLSLPIAYNSGVLGRGYPAGIAYLGALVGFALLWPALKKIPFLLSYRKHIKSTVVRRASAPSSASIKAASATI